MKVRLNQPQCRECVTECSSILLDGNELVLTFIERPGHYFHVICRSEAEAHGLFEEACETGYVDLRGFQYVR